MSLSTIVRAISNALGRHKSQQKRHSTPPSTPHYRAEFLGGEWWVLASDSTPLISYGSDGRRAKSSALTLNENCRITSKSIDRAKANRARIQEHVRKHFSHLPYVR